MRVVGAIGDNASLDVRTCESIAELLAQLEQTDRVCADISMGPSGPMAAGELVV